MSKTKEYLKQHVHGFEWLKLDFKRPKSWK